MIKALLILNTGSSSLKFQALRYDDMELLLSGKVADIGGEARLSAKVVEGRTSVIQDLGEVDHDGALSAVIELIDRHDDNWALAAVVHRVVHGGQHFITPVRVTPAVLAELEALSPLAPLHQPHNLAGMAAAAKLAPRAANIACFDTAFHAGAEPLFTTLALPAELRAHGLRRYGFHGLSYEWIARRLAADRPDLASGRVVAAHLGNGASVCGIVNGASVDTSMGLTAVDGLPMGTRCGAIDPGAVTYMMRALGYDAERVDRVLYEQSGLKGLSGVDNDVEALMASDAPEARFALDFFALKVAQFTALMAVSMGGVDAIVFTGGIGENAAPIRQVVMDRLAFLGPVEALVIPANEERMMALHAKRLLEAGQ